MRSCPTAWLTAAFLVAPGPMIPASAESHSSVTGNFHREAVVTNRATGTFEVKVLPLPTDEGVDTGGFPRLSLDKRFSGDLAGSSRGQMVATSSKVEGSGAYVALERVSGTLNGRTGSFILQHNGTMSRGTQEMRITVVPDSGTEELSGLAGTMRIIIEGGKHRYEFEYTLGG